jgi:pilus assembly protein TadC
LRQRPSKFSRLKSLVAAFLLASAVIGFLLAALVLGSFIAVLCLIVVAATLIVVIARVAFYRARMRRSSRLTWRATDAADALS